MIRGWRLGVLVSVRGGRYRVLGVRGQPWRKDHAATCHRVSFVSHFSPAPVEDCECGYHVARHKSGALSAFSWEPQSWRSLAKHCLVHDPYTGGYFWQRRPSPPPIRRRLALLQIGVTAWGKVIPHRKGWRVQYFRPEHVAAAYVVDPRLTERLPDMISRALPNVTVGFDAPRVGRRFREWGVKDRGIFYGTYEGNHVIRYHEPDGTERERPCSWYVFDGRDWRPE